MTNTSATLAAAMLVAQECGDDVKRIYTFESLGAVQHGEDHCASRINQGAAVSSNGSVQHHFPIFFSDPVAGVTLLLVGDYEDGKRPTNDQILASQQVVWTEEDIIGIARADNCVIHQHAARKGKNSGKMNNGENVVLEKILDVLGHHPRDLFANESGKGMGGGIVLSGYGAAVGGAGISSYEGDTDKRQENSLRQSRLDAIGDEGTAEEALKAILGAQADAVEKSRVREANSTLVSTGFAAQSYVSGSIEDRLADIKRLRSNVVAERKPGERSFGRGKGGQRDRSNESLVKPGGAPPVAVVCLSHHLKDGEAEDEPVRSERLVHLVDVEAAAPVHVEGCERCAESADSVTVGMCVSVWRRGGPPGDWGVRSRGVRFRW